MDKRKIYAIIPARGGSKGIPGKNIKLLDGKPLIYYTIKESFKSQYLNEIFVSTDDPIIAEVSKKCGANIIKRPPELAADDSPTIDAIIHAINTIKCDNDQDILVLLQPTSPLRKANDIDAAIELFLERECDSVISMCKVDHPPYWCFIMNNGILQPLFGDKYLKMRRQELPEIYRPNGAIYITSLGNLYKNKGFYCDKMIPYQMSPEKSIDIDNEIDFKIAEIMVRNEKQNGKVVRIKSREAPCFIIAEAGVNHNGNLNIAKQLIDVAKEAGVDAVKFQTFISEEVVSNDAPKAEYQKQTTDASESQLDMIKKLELSEEDHKKLVIYAKQKNILFLSTPFDMKSADLLVELGVPLIKISSGEITNYPFLRHIARKNLPIILSTGMSTLEEVADAISVLKEAGCKDLILLHCTSNYPARVEDCNLLAMKTMMDAFGLPVGYSDHTPGIYVSIIAAALGACVIEKHFTLDKNLPGPDHKASLEPHELKEMIKGIRIIEKALGSPVKAPVQSEFEVRDVARRSIVARDDIPAGTVITENMLAFKRPGTGISPKFAGKLIGTKARYNMKKNDLIKL